MFTGEELRPYIVQKAPRPTSATAGLGLHRPYLAYSYTHCPVLISRTFSLTPAGLVYNFGQITGNLSASVFTVKCWWLSLLLRYLTTDAITVDQGLSQALLRLSPTHLSLSMIVCSRWAMVMVVQWENSVWMAVWMS